MCLCADSCWCISPSDCPAGEALLFLLYTALQVLLYGFSAVVLEYSQRTPYAPPILASFMLGCVRVCLLACALQTCFVYATHPSRCARAYGASPPLSPLPLPLPRTPRLFIALEVRKRYSSVSIDGRDTAAEEAYRMICWKLVRIPASYASPPSLSPGFRKLVPGAS